MLRFFSNNTKENIPRIEDKVRAFIHNKLSAETPTLNGERMDCTYSESSWLVSSTQVCSTDDVIYTREFSVQNAGLGISTSDEKKVTKIPRGKVFNIPPATPLIMSDFKDTKVGFKLSVLPGVCRENFIESTKVEDQLNAEMLQKANTSQFKFCRNKLTTDYCPLEEGSGLKYKGEITCHALTSSWAIDHNFRKVVKIETGTDPFVCAHLNQLKSKL